MCVRIAVRKRWKVSRKVWQESTLVYRRESKMDLIDRLSVCIEWLFRIETATKQDFVLFLHIVSN